MNLKSSELTKADIKYGVYYTDGADVYWLKRVEDTFRSILPDDSLSLFVFDKLNSLEEPLTALETVSFFGGDNVVIVKDSDYKISDKEHAMLEKLQVNEGYLLFVNAKFLNVKEKKSFNVINCVKSDRNECIKYAAELFPNGVDRNALYRLAEYTDCDMAKICNEAKKLSDYCGDGKVTLQDVEELVTEDTELQIFAFVSSVTEGKSDLAVKQLKRLIKRGEAPSYMLSALIGQYRRLLHASLSSKSDAELADTMKVKEYAIKKARSGRKITKKQLKSTVDMLVGYELKFKSGEMGERAAFNAAVSRLIGMEV